MSEKNDESLLWKLLFYFPENIRMFILLLLANPRTIIRSNIGKIISHNPPPNFQTFKGGFKKKFEGRKTKATTQGGFGKRK